MAVSYTLLLHPKFQSLLADGTSNAGGKVYTYQAGTLTLLTTYSDPGLTVANTNPIILDANGQADIWVSGPYKMIVQDANGVQLYSSDQLFGFKSDLFCSLPTQAADRLLAWDSASSHFKNSNMSLSAIETAVGAFNTVLVNGGGGVVAAGSGDTSLGTLYDKISAGPGIAKKVITDGLGGKTLSLSDGSDVRSYGVTADGLTDDTAAFSAMLTTIGSTQTTISIGSKIKISGNITVPKNVSLLIVNGGGFVGTAGTEALSIASYVSAGLYTIFTNCLVTFTLQSEVYPEWWGAKGDGTTDDKLAIQAALNSAGNVYLGITVLLRSAIYITSGMLSITKHRVNLIGCGIGATQIQCTSATDNILAVQGAIASRISNNVVRGIYFYRTVAATGGYGVKLEYLTGPEIESVQSEGSLIGFYLHGCGNPNLSKCTASYTAVTALQCIGFRLDGGQLAGSQTDPVISQHSNASSTFRDCGSSLTGCTHASSIGMHIYGNYCADVFVEWFGTLRAAYGVLIDGTLAIQNDPSYSWDIHIVHSTFDEFSVHGVDVYNFLNESGVTVDGCWFNAIAYSAVDVYVTNCRGVRAINNEFHSFSKPCTGDGSGASGLDGVRLTNSQDCIISNNQFRGKKYGIYLTDVSKSVLSGNTFYNRVAQKAYMHMIVQISSSGSLNNVINGNSFDGSSDYCLFVAAGCNNNIITSNQCATVTNLGTGNVLVNNV